MGLLEGQRGVIAGVANRRSIAWAIAERFHAEGARLAFTYQGERVRAKVEGLLEGLGAPPAFPCDVSSNEDVARFCGQAIEALDGRVDFLVHSVAFARMEDLDGRYVDTSREGFSQALDISAYSLAALSRGLLPAMGHGGSILAMTYLGAERAVPNYNVMGVAKAALESSIRYLAADLGPEGVRVNGLSAGPIRTLSARAISGLNTMLAHHAEKAPLRRNVTAEEVADAALFLASRLSRAVTGEVLYVDCGYRHVGL